jgi:drug/metabolite transporter (DMT)-like permease
MKLTASASKRPLDWVLLGTVTLLFASGFTLIDITITTITPMSMMAGRVVLATGMLYVWVRALGYCLPPWRDKAGQLSRLWRYFLILGLVSHVLPATLIPWGQREVDSGLAAILVGLTPLMTLALSALCVSSERIDRRHLAGFGLGFLGIIVLTGPEALGLITRQSWLHEAAILSGALCFALNALLIKSMPPVHPLVASAGISLCASLLAVPMALLFDMPWALKPSAVSLAGLILLGLFPTAYASILYVMLIRSAGPAFGVLSNYLVPPLAVFLGLVFLGQHLAWNAYVALVLILVGVATSQGHR